MKFEDKVKILREKKHKGKETQAFLLDVKAMTEGEAFEYCMGVVSFCDTVVDLSYKPMIPRPETEYWVKEVLCDLQERKPSKVLDMFCGSGCVGLSVLKNIPESVVTFVDIVPTTEKQVLLSCDRNKIPSDRFSVHEEDGEQFLQQLEVGSYEVILAVPPYVPKSMHDEVMQELHAEQPVFFFDKEEGMYYISKVLIEAKRILASGGVLYMEFDITQKETLEKFLQEKNFENFSFLKDPYGHECALKVLF